MCNVKIYQFAIVIETEPLLCSCPEHLCAMLFLLLSSALWTFAHHVLQRRLHKVKAYALSAIPEVLLPSNQSSWMGLVHTMVLRNCQRACHLYSSAPVLPCSSCHAWCPDGAGCELEVPSVRKLSGRITACSSSFYLCRAMQETKASLQLLYDCFQHDNCN